MDFETTGYDVVDDDDDDDDNNDNDNNDDDGNISATKPRISEPAGVGSSERRSIFCNAMKGRNTGVTVDSNDDDDSVDVDEGRRNVVASSVERCRCENAKDSGIKNRLTEIAVFHLKSSLKFRWNLPL